MRSENADQKRFGVGQLLILSRGLIAALWEECRSHAPLTRPVAGFESRGVTHWTLPPGCRRSTYRAGNRATPKLEMSLDRKLLTRGLCRGCVTSLSKETGLDERSFGHCRKVRFPSKTLGLDLAWLRTVDVHVPHGTYVNHTACRRIVDFLLQSHTPLCARRSTIFVNRARVSVRGLYTSSQKA